MKSIKKFVPIFLILTFIMGLIYRKFLWCNILLPAEGEPYGLGDIVEFIPILLLIGLSAGGFIASILLLFVSKFKDRKFGLILLVLSVIATPVYLKIHTTVKAVCTKK